MKIALKSDFRDCYDKYFTTTLMPYDAIFTRVMKTFVPKHQQFQVLSHMGLSTPLIGIIRDMFNAGHRLDQWVVVYGDLFEHASGGKRIMLLKDAMEFYPDNFCSVFIEPKENATSYRFLQVGARAFWLKYKSDDQWRSNVGDVKVEVLRETDPKYAIGYPLLGIDFIEHVDGGLDKRDAIDFNTSPSLTPLMVDGFMTEKQMYQEIHNWFFGCKDARF